LPLQIELPKFYTNLIIIGDLVRQNIAHEIAVKTAETSHLNVRSFGIEEFLHGPLITIDKETSIIIFATRSEPRYEALIEYAKTIGSEIIIIDENYFSCRNIPKEFTWLAQLLYGQQLALELSKVRKTNPDINRQDQSPYSEAADSLKRAKIE
jgi:fructoselysine-6-P-deglycase FrlB-like protein